jgi:hypothetical protein
LTLIDAVARPAVVQKLQHAFLSDGVRGSISVADFASHKVSAETIRTGDAMRESLGTSSFDPAPYKEWLGVVGSLIVAALVWAFVLS